MQVTLPALLPLGLDLPIQLEARAHRTLYVRSECRVSAFSRVRGIIEDLVNALAIQPPVESVVDQIHGDSRHAVEPLAEREHDFSLAVSDFPLGCNGLRPVALRIAERA